MIPLVGQIMTKKVVTVGPDDSLHQVKEIFDSTKFHHLLVVDGENKLVGVVSDRDLLRAISPAAGTIAETTKDAATLNKRVHQIMSRKLVTVTADSGYYDAVELFKTHSISCLPVVDARHAAVGIVSWRDTLRALRPPKKTT